MIVLDEQLLGLGLQDIIARWYPGSVTDITQLRSGTRTLDDAIPSILHGARSPTFVTINVADFWLKLQPDAKFCVVCVALSHEQCAELPDLLRDVLALPQFNTKKRRMGKVIRVLPSRVEFYCTDARGCGNRLAVIRK
jgi:hypothetical protein